MNGMAAEGVWNPKSKGEKLGSRGFRGERVLKEEEKQATGGMVPGLKEGGRISCAFHPR
jgi:hypothetical protein